MIIQQIPYNTSPSPKTMLHRQIYRALGATNSKKNALSWCFALILAWSLLTSSNAASRSSLSLSDQYPLALYEDIHFVKCDSRIADKFPLYGKFIANILDRLALHYKTEPCQPRKGGRETSTKAMKFPTPARFQVHLRSFLTPAHMNLARWQLKKIWLQSSNAPYSAHLPFDGPCLLATCSHVGKHSLLSCQRNTLILGGTFVHRTSLKRVIVVPCNNRR
jgi:hypothetical protein